MVLGPTRLTSRPCLTRNQILHRHLHPQLSCPSVHHRHSRDGLPLASHRHMAVVASHTLPTKPSPRVTTSIEIPSLRATELMTSIMSYQYPPPPPPNGAEMDIPPPGYMPSYGIPQPATSPMDMRPGQESPMSLKDRKDSLSQASLKKIKRSLSTPNVRSQQNSSDSVSMGMSSEKRRNKLGYHRTSVACGTLSSIRVLPFCG